MQSYEKNLTFANYNTFFCLIIITLSLLKLCSPAVGESNEPVWGMLEQGCAQVVDDAGHIGLLALEHAFQCPLDKFLGGYTDGEVDRQLAQVRREAEECCIDSAWGHNGDIDALRIKLVPERLAEIVDERFGGIVGLNTRVRHPGGHGGHIQDIAFLPGPAQDALLPLIIGQFTLNHILCKKARELSYRDYMQHQHPLKARHSRFHQRVEEEHSGVVDEYIHLELVIQAVLMQLLGRIGFAQVGIERQGFHLVSLCQILSDLHLLLLLIADEQQVGVVIASQGRCVLQANAR